MPRAILLVSFLALAACLGQGDPAPDAPPDCGASALQHLVGQPVGVLDAHPLPDPHRIIGPDMAVTMDWVPERVNVEHDARMVITRIRCG